MNINGKFSIMMYFYVVECKYSIMFQISEFSSIYIIRNPKFNNKVEIISMQFFSFEFSRRTKRREEKVQKHKNEKGISPTIKALKNFSECSALGKVSNFS